MIAFKPLKWSCFFIGVLLVCLGASSTYAVAKKSKITLHSPAQIKESQKDKLLFKGQAPGVKQLKLNGQALFISDQDRFYHRVTMSTPNKTYVFKLVGIFEDGTKETIVKKITYKPKFLDLKPDVEMLQPKADTQVSTNFIVFSGKVHNTHYVSLGKEKLFLDSDNRFYHRVLLPKKGDYQFQLKMYGKDGSVQSISRKVSRVSEKELLLGKKRTASEKVKEKVKRAKRLEADKKIAKKKSSQSKLLKSSLVKSASNAKKGVQMAASHGIPQIFLKSPVNNQITYNDMVSFKGRVTNAREFFINNRVVQVSAKGQFDEQVSLKEFGKHVFNLYAIGDNNLNTTIIRKVHRLSSDESIQARKKQTGKSILDNQLSKRVSLELSGVDIRHVMQILSKKGGFNIVADKSLKGVVHLSLQNVTIINALDLVLNTHGLAYKIVGNTIVVGEESRINKATRLITKIIRLDNVSSADAEKVIQKYLSGTESVQSVIQDNLIILNVDPKKLDEMMDIVIRLDSQKVPQIMVEAQILEVSKSSLDNLGVSWSNNYGLGFTGTLNNSGFNYVSNMSLQTVINMLESDGKARVLAKPRIKAIDREDAEIFIGDELPYIELSTDPSGRVQESVKFVESGIKLKLKPNINPHTKEIKIKIEPEVSYVNGFKGPNNDIPIVRTRKVSTTVFVKDNNTVLIGGLFNSSDTDNISKFPFLGNLPLLGAFFTSSKMSNDETELVIAITPKIMNIDINEEILPKQKEATAVMSQNKLSQ